MHQESDGTDNGLVILSLPPHNNPSLKQQAVPPVALFTKPALNQTLQARWQALLSTPPM